MLYLNFFLIILLIGCFSLFFLLYLFKYLLLRFNIIEKKYTLIQFLKLMMESLSVFTTGAHSSYIDKIKSPLFNKVKDDKQKNFLNLLLQIFIICLLAFLFFVSTICVPFVLLIK